MKCNVVLCGDAQNETISCIGELNIKGKGFALSYSYGGDSCLLAYDGHILRHKKEGEIPVCINFILNENTACTIGDSAFSGEIPVLTNSLNVHMVAKTLSISVVYELGGEIKKMKISAESI